MARFLFVATALLINVFYAAQSQAEPLVLTWQDLEPAADTGVPMTLPKNSKILGTPATQDFRVTEAELKEMLGEIEFMKDMQPQDSRLVGKLDGKRVRIPGYATPVGFNGEDVTQFLLVPYLGACIHVPPPPANQIVFVKNAKGLTVSQVWEPIWLTGVLRTKSVSTVLADVGYTIEEGTVEPYEAYPENIKDAH